MACDYPVLVFHTTSMPEVCGDAALYCNPLDPDGIRDEVEAIPSGRYMAKRGIEKARIYTWERSAKIHSKILLMC